MAIKSTVEIGRYGNVKVHTRKKNNGVTRVTVNEEVDENSIVLLLCKAEVVELAKALILAGDNMDDEMMWER